jgi:hypothetical protein
VEALIVEQSLDPLDCSYRRGGRERERERGQNQLEVVFSRLSASLRLDTLYSKSKLENFKKVV